MYFILFRQWRWRVEESAKNRNTFFFKQVKAEVSLRISHITTNEKSDVTSKNNNMDQKREKDKKLRDNDGKKKWKSEYKGQQSTNDRLQA